MKFTMEIYNSYERSLETYIILYEWVPNYTLVLA